MSHTPDTVSTAGACGRHCLEDHQVLEEEEGTPEYQWLLATVTMVLSFGIRKR